MDFNQFSSQFYKKIHDPSFLIEFEKNKSWPNDPTELTKYYNLLSKNQTFQVSNPDYTDLFYKLFFHKTIDNNQFYEHIFYYVESLKKLPKPITITPIQNLSFILNICRHALENKDFEGFIDILNGAYDYAQKFYLTKDEFHNSLIYAVSYSSIIDHEYCLPSFSETQVKELTQLINTIPNKFLTHFITYLFTLTPNDKNEYQFIHLGKNNPKEFMFLLSHNDIVLGNIDKRKKQKPLLLLADNANELIFDIVEYLINDDKYSDAIKIIKNTSSDNLTYYFLTDNNKQFSFQLARELIKDDLFFFYHLSNPLKQFEFIFYLKENKLEDLFIKEVLCQNPNFHSLFENKTYIASILDNHENSSFGIEEKYPFYKETKDLSEHTIFSFIKTGFSSQTASLNYISYSRCLFLLNNNNLSELDNFLESLNKVDFLEGFKNSAKDLILLSSLTINENSQRLQDLIFEKELNKQLPNIEFRKKSFKF